tara:strand:+ start:62 stop:232 length:171 start_codon:yes stop_codon:yes gene_type:complete
MNFITYIVNEENEKVTFIPEKQEVKNIESQIKWGLKDGIVSLVNEIRTSTTYWEIV